MSYAYVCNCSIMEPETTIKFGFWYSASESDLPMPIESDEDYITGFVDRCKEWVAHLPNIKKYQFSSDLSILIDYRFVSYMGYAPCRICDKDNGDSEYTHGGYTFPSGIFHYILDHHIAVPIEFQHMIVREPLIDPTTLNRRSRLENAMLFMQGAAHIKYT